MSTDPDAAQRRDTVLVVDDQRDGQRIIEFVLKDQYDLRLAQDGESALQQACAEPLPSLILLDVLMPGMDGHEVCRRLKADARTRHIPVIFLTARADVAAEEAGFALGAVDYIGKPVSPPLLRARVGNHLALKHAADVLRNQNTTLEAEVARRTRELSAIQEVTAMSLAVLAETRDADTSNHILRTQAYVRALARRLASHPRFSTFLTSANIQLLHKCVPLHDIGKVGIPDRILLKPGRLTPEEFEVMKTHAAMGSEAIARAEEILGTELPFLQLAKEIARHHHEKWDGTGYPEGLQGDAIPISARLMAVADVYDALISRRVYKAPMPHEQAMEIIRASAGRHLDPDVTQAFIDLEATMHDIALAYTDSDSDLQRKRTYLAAARIQD